jgi:hypothetical protein
MSTIQKSKGKKVSFLLPEGHRSRSSSYTQESTNYIPKKIRYVSSRKPLYSRPKSKRHPKVDPYFNSIFITSGFVLPVSMSQGNKRVINPEEDGNCKCSIM